MIDYYSIGIRGLRHQFIEESSIGCTEILVGVMQRRADQWFEVRLAQSPYFRCKPNPSGLDVSKCGPQDNVTLEGLCTHGNSSAYPKLH